jgi:hypothetical protein
MKGEIMSDQVVYTSTARIERVKGPLRRAYLPQTESPVLFGVHSEIAEHYGVDPNVHSPRELSAARWKRAKFLQAKVFFPQKQAERLKKKGKYW